MKKLLCRWLGHRYEFKSFLKYGDVAYMMTCDRCDRVLVEWGGGKEPASQTPAWIAKGATQTEWR